MPLAPRCERDSHLFSGDTDAASIPRSPASGPLACAPRPRPGRGHGVQGRHDHHDHRTRRLYRSRWRGQEGGEAGRRSGEGREEHGGEARGSSDPSRSRAGAGLFDVARPIGACACGNAAGAGSRRSDDARDASADEARRSTANGAAVRRARQQHGPHRRYGAVQRRYVLALDQPPRRVCAAPGRREVALT